MRDGPPGQALAPPVRVAHTGLDMDAARPHPDLETTLARAWAALAGERCTFTSLDALPDIQPGDACFQLPVLRPDGLEAGRVLLVLGDEDSQQLGVSMFGLPLDELGQAELDDATAELCNIFGSCLVAALDHSHRLELGLPQRAGAGTYEELCCQRMPRLTLATALGPRRVLVAYFDGDAPALPAAQEPGHG